METKTAQTLITDEQKKAFWANIYEQFDVWRDDALDAISSIWHGDGSFWWEEDLNDLLGLSDLIDKLKHMGPMQECVSDYACGYFSDVLDAAEEEAEEAFDFLLGTPLTLEYNGDVEHDIPQYHGASK